PLVPTLKPGESEDLLKYYTREKVGHSTVLVSLVKNGILSLNKSKIYSNTLPGEITATTIDEAITPAEENELIDKITTGEEIDSSSGGILLHGKDSENTAQPVGMSGEENDEIQVMNLDVETILEDIYLELIKANIQMSIITGDHIKNRDIDALQRN
ncbi:hypothetical protein LCGC14_2096270, partial [marine sediment metagenome]